MKKTALMLIVLGTVFIGSSAFCQVLLSSSDFRKLSLEDQLKTYFDTYRDGHTALNFPRYAGYIVSSYGLEVIPYLKEYMKDANLFSLRKNWPPLDSNPNFYSGEPNDITLELIACIWSRLHLYTDPITFQPYTLDEKEIKWFIDEYKQRIDDYVLTIKVIDETILASERMLYWIACYGTELKDLEKYGHPYFGIPELYRRGLVLKEYYEQRLGLTGLTVDYNVFEK